MISRNQPRATKEEAQRIKIMKANGCMLTWLKFGEKKYAEVHHIVMPGKRLGHWYTIPLTPWYHRGTCDPGKTKAEMRAKYGASLSDGTRAFVASHHYTELELWQKLQVVMGLDDSLPPTKVLPRRGYVATRLAQDSPSEAPAAALCAEGSDVVGAARVGPEANAAAAEEGR